MTCVLTVLAEVQAVADQLVGVAETSAMPPASPAELRLANHDMTLARFLQATIDAYEVQHGATDASFKVRAARKLRLALKA
jgi:hypothetical protein